MKKHNKCFTKPLLCLFVCILLTSQIFSLCAFADTDESEFVQWTVSIDGKTLSTPDKTYTMYPRSGFIEDPQTVYVFANTVQITNDNGYTSAYQIYSCGKDFPIVWIDGLNGETRYYATEEGANLLDDLLSEQNCSFRLFDTHSYNLFSVDEALISKMNGIVASEETDVTTLEYVQKYNIYSYDATDNFYSVYGMVFSMPGGYYYVKYSNLDNSHFDANGKFSYRQGTVLLAKLDYDTALALSEVIESEAEIRNNIYEYEDPSVNEIIFPPEFFWIGFVLFGILAPIPGLVTGFVLPQIKPLGKPKYWYWLSAVCIVWIVLAIVLAILIII